MEDNPAIDPGDEIPVPEPALTARGVVPHTGHADPEPPLVSPGRHARHGGAPLLQVEAAGAGEAPGGLQVTPVQREVKFLRASLPASHTALININRHLIILMFCYTLDLANPRRKSEAEPTSSSCLLC